MSYPINDFRSNGDFDTGHGLSENLWITFGKVKIAMNEIKNWLNMHHTETIVIYFGNMLGNVTKGHKELKDILEVEFNGLNGNVGLNDFWQKNEEWPTLAQAKESNQRVFAIVRTKTEDQAQNFVSTKIMPEKQYKFDKPATDLGVGKFITILSTYESINIGNKCQSLVENIGKICGVHPEAEFVKIALFGTHAKLKNSPTKCLSKLARTCNQQTKNATVVKNGVLKFRRPE